MNLMDKLAEHAKDYLSKSLYSVDHDGGKKIKIMLNAEQVMLIQHFPEHSRVQITRGQLGQSCDSYGMALEVMLDWFRKMFNEGIPQHSDILKRAADRYRSDQNDYNDLHVLAKAYVNGINADHMKTIRVIYDLAHDLQVACDGFPQNHLKVILAAKAMISGLFNMKIQMDALGLAIDPKKVEQYNQLMKVTNEMQQVLSDLYDSKYQKG